MLARGGFLMTELVIALGIVALVLIPLGFSTLAERRLEQMERQRAVAMTIVDGEMEVLRAGAWRALEPGEHDYSVRAESAATLPAGRFVTTLTNGLLRLEWRPARRHQGGVIAREVKLP